MGINFFMDQNMVNLMGNEIDSFPDLQPVNLLRSVNKKSMDAWIGPKRAREISDELNLFGTIKEVPAELMQTILLNEIH
jgi:hypothetical protein